MERKITRKIVKSRIYDIYALENGNARFLETIEVEGRIKERELCSKHNVKNIAAELKKENVEIYSVPVSKFMEIATLETEQEQ